MNTEVNIPEIIKQMDLSGISRIDYALEGDWDNTLKTVWRRGDDEMDFDGIIRIHDKYEPTFELFFDGYFIGIMCYKNTDVGFEFDEEKANSIFAYVKDSLSN